MGARKPLKWNLNLNLEDIVLRAQELAGIHLEEIQDAKETEDQTFRDQRTWIQTMNTKKIAR